MDQTPPHTRSRCSCGAYPRPLRGKRWPSGHTVVVCKSLIRGTCVCGESGCRMCNRINGRQEPRWGCG